MALVAAFIVFFVGVLSAALTRQVTDEFKAWIPWVVQCVIRRAIGRLPEAQRKRFEEEWQSHINEIPGEVGKLVVAFGFLSASSKMSANVPHEGSTARGITIRRSLDVFLSATCLLFSAPTIALIALAIRVNGTGPVFAVEERLGFNGRKFRMYRFSASGWLGTFLFRSSLSMLPFFVNVLRGEMTLVGPGPLKPF